LPNPVVVNVVATSELGESLELSEVSQIEHTIFDQEIYGGRVAYLKKPSMHGKVTIFPSGKLISVGTHSLDEAEADLQETANTLHASGLIRKVKMKARLRNLVAVLTTKPISLEDFAFETRAIYEPEQFPAAILKTGTPERTFLIFNSGKIVLSGIKSMDDLDQAVRQIISILEEAEINYR
jgi:transcription initiation factor TFIID TATA-box-binding protein